MAEAVLAPGQRDDALGRELLQHVLADRAVEHRARVRVVAEQERDVEDRDLGHEVRHRAGRGHRQVERAELQRLDRLALGAERAGVEVLDLVAAVGALLDLAREGVDRHAVVRVLATEMFIFSVVCASGGRGERQRAARRGERAKQAGNPHGYPPVIGGHRLPAGESAPERGF